MEHIVPAVESEEISIRLEQYDDIFSDFDIRPYARRALSVDFLDEIKRASADKRDDGVELVLFVPEAARNADQEATIKDRLAAHFKRHAKLLEGERSGVIRMGITMLALGVACMTSAALIVFGNPSASLLLSFLIVFLEPAGWFLFWEGLDKALFESKAVKPELDFYRKMSHAKARVHFVSY